MTVSREVRDEKVIVKLSPSIKAKLQTHCEELGVSMSGYIAVVIGQTLKQATTAEDAMKAMIEQMGKEGVIEGIKLAQNADQ
jgi:predicted exporter